MKNRKIPANICDSGIQNGGHKTQTNIDSFPAFGLLETMLAA
jgi:hypothetical protein